MDQGTRERLAREELQNAKSQTEAAWLAAKQAQRAVTVAWIAALVGLVSAVATIFSPYLSESFNTERNERELSTARTILVPGLQALLRRVQAEEKLPRYAGAANPDRLREEEVPTFSFELRDLENFNAEQDAIIAKLPIDAAVLNLAEVRRSGVAYLRANYQSRIDDVRQHNADVYVETKLKRGGRIPPFYKATVATEEKSFQHIRNLLLNIRLNSEDGRPIAGRPVYGNCNDDQYKKLCDEVITLY